MYKHTYTRLHSLFLAASLLTLFTLILAGCGGGQRGSNPQSPGSATPTISSATPTSVPTPTPTQIPPLPTPTRPAQPIVPFTLMHMLDQQHGWALTASSILKTADGGQTWQDVTPSKINALIGAGTVFYNPLTAWVNITKPFGAIDKAFQLIHTTDGGQTWTTQNAQVNTPAIEILDTNFINAREGWIEIDEGSGMGQQAVGIVHTANGGASWKLVSTSVNPPSGVGTIPASGRKTGLTFANSNTGWADVTTYGSNQDYVYVTHDGGISWILQTLPPPIAKTRVMGGTTPPIIFGQEIVMPALENNGFTLYLSHNGGTTWQANPVVLPAGQRTIVDKDNMYVVDPTHAWAIDEQGVLYITTNGGQSWNSSSILHNVSQFSFISHTTGWAYSGPNQNVPTLLKTTDGGRSWSKVNYRIY